MHTVARREMCRREVTFPPFSPASPPVIIAVAIPAYFSPSSEKNCGDIQSTPPRPWAKSVKMLFSHVPYKLGSMSSYTSGCQRHTHTRAFLPSRFRHNFFTSRHWRTSPKSNLPQPIEKHQTRVYLRYKWCNFYCVSGKQTLSKCVTSMSCWLQ